MHPPTKRAVLKGLAELANITIWAFALYYYIIPSLEDFTGKKNAH